jgi:hypothetical protein
MDEGKSGHDVALPVGNGDYEVKQGECIYSIAAATGHLWRTIWEHPQNEALRQARQEPGVLLPGDRVFVPPLTVKSVLLPSGRRHRIVIDGETVPLRLRMCDADGQPMAKTAYRLEVDGQTIPVTTQDDGSCEVQVPIRAQQALLVCDDDDGETYVLHLGHMDPPDSASGMRKRLANLGYRPDATEGEIDEYTQHLLDEFSQDAELEGETSRAEVARRLARRDPWSA